MSHEEEVWGGEAGPPLKRKRGRGIEAEVLLSENEVVDDGKKLSHSDTCQAICDGNSSVTEKETPRIKKSDAEEKDGKDGSEIVSSKKVEVPVQGGDKRQRLENSEEDNKDSEGDTTSEIEQSGSVVGADPKRDITAESEKVANSGQEAKSVESKHGSSSSMRQKTVGMNIVGTENNSEQAHNTPGESAAAGDKNHRQEGRDKEISDARTRPDREQKARKDKSNEHVILSSPLQAVHNKDDETQSPAWHLNKPMRDHSRLDGNPNEKTLEGLSSSPPMVRTESEGAVPKAPRPSSASHVSAASQKKKSPGTSSSGSSSATAASGGIDAHPFPRGNVIEVLHYPNGSVNEDYDDGDDDEEMVEGLEGGVQSRSSKGSPTVRLCDIIDRAPVPTARPNEPPARRWRYYVHYRDFNRRMDEWVTSERIVSPPSVGNAKVRALKKKKEEDEKRIAAERAVAADRAAVAAASLRRESAAITAPTVGSVPSGHGTTTAEDEGDSASISRKKRRRSVDNSTVAAAAGTMSAASAATAGGSTYQEGRQRAVRASSRRASTAITAASGGSAEGREDEGADNEGEATTATESSSGVGGGSSVMSTQGSTSTSPQAAASAQRLTRRQRRKAPEIAADGSGSIMLPVGARDLSDDTPRIGVDVVATVPAQDLDEHEGLDEASLREHEEVTKVKNVAQLELGQYRMDTWYFSPIPKELLKENGMIDVLYVCEFTLNFFTRKEELQRFQAKELAKEKRHPPGNEIYRNGNLSMFEVDGFQEKVYSQNLCYIAKLFLDHKTLYFDVDPFLFYVLCEVDERGFHPVGYYSKEKYSDVGYNLACILTFPSHQRKGYGRFLIAFSYELSKREEKVGSPEKPVSDLGQKAYKPYWTSTVVDFLLNHSHDAGSLSIMDISKRTSIMAEDIVFALNQLGILKFINGVYFILAERSLLEELARKHPIKEPRVDPSKLHWTPFITDVKRDKFSIHSKKPSVDDEDSRAPN